MKIKGHGPADIDYGKLELLENFDKLDETVLSQVVIKFFKEYS